MATIYPAPGSGGGGGGTATNEIADAIDAMFSLS